jgi:hypothetical protein
MKPAFNAFARQPDRLWPRNSSHEWVAKQSATRIREAFPAVEIGPDILVTFGFDHPATMPACL